MRRTIYTHLGAGKQERWRDLACTGHWRHKTIEEATLALRALEMQGEQGLNVYDCLWCLGYHVGHGPGKRAHDEGH